MTVQSKCLIELSLHCTTGSTWHDHCQKLIKRVYNRTDFIRITLLELNINLHKQLCTYLLEYYKVCMHIYLAIELLISTIFQLVRVTNDDACGA